MATADPIRPVPAGPVSGPPPQVAQEAAPPAEDRGTFQPFGADGFGFGDLLDIINPLQHIPIVSAIYRRITGDEIAAAPRVLGGALFGGPIGAAVSLVSAVFHETTGDDPAGHALAYILDDKVPEATAVADGSGPGGGQSVHAAAWRNPDVAAPAAPWFDPDRAAPAIATAWRDPDAGATPPAAWHNPDGRAVAIAQPTEGLPAPARTLVAGAATASAFTARPVDSQSTTGTLPPPAADGPTGGAATAPLRRGDPRVRAVTAEPARLGPPGADPQVARTEAATSASQMAALASAQRGRPSGAARDGIPAWLSYLPAGAGATEIASRLDASDAAATATIPSIRDRLAPPDAGDRPTPPDTSGSDSIRPGALDRAALQATASDGWFAQAMLAGLGKYAQGAALGAPPVRPAQTGVY